MGWFGITANERQQCLTYYEAGLTVTAFLDREADAYNNTLCGCLNITAAEHFIAAAENPLAAELMARGASRLVQAARGAIRRYDQIRPIPDAAATLHLALREALLSYLSWAEAALSSMEALTNGTTPNLAHQQPLVENRQLAEGHALEAVKAFLRRIRATAADIEAINHRIASTTAADPWQPKPTVHDVRLSFAFGCTFSQQGDYAKAIKHFTECIDLDPTYADAYVNLAETYMLLGQHVPAIEAFRDALRINPEIAEAHYNLGCIYQNLGRYEDALTSYRAAAAARPDYALPYCNIGVLALGFGRYKESAEALERTIALDPTGVQGGNLPGALYGLASAYFHLADNERAFEVCSRLVQTNPEYSDAQRLLAAIQSKLGEVATSCSDERNMP